MVSLQSLPLVQEGLPIPLQLGAAHSCLFPAIPNYLVLSSRSQAL